MTNRIVGLRALQNLHEIKPHLPCRDGIEMAERFIHQQDVRFDGKGAGNRDALLHSARQVERIVALLPGQPDHVQVLRHRSRQLDRGTFCASKTK